MDVRKLVFLLPFSLLVVFTLADNYSNFDYTPKDLVSDDTLLELYERWTTNHKISHTLTDKQKRFNVFRENLNHIHNVNQVGKKPYKLKLNKFADMTNYEFMHYRGSKVSHYKSMLDFPRTKTSFMHENTTHLPTSIDWRKKGAVNAIKDQGNCGSCWAFSTVAAVEGINKIRTGELVALSEQELIDCNKKNHGCEGGYMEEAYKYLEHKRRGLRREKDYPYKSKDERCIRNITSWGVDEVIINGYEMVPAKDEVALLKAVANQPVSIAIDAGGKDWQFYSKGVFSGECGTELNHAVLIVGYGTTKEGMKYWIVRNSWGIDWGEGGYFRIQRQVDAKEGLCGLAIDATYPLKLHPHNYY